MEAFNQRRIYQLSSRANRVFEQLCRQTGRKAGPPLTDHIAILSKLFTKERTGIGSRYMDEPDLLAAYRAYFLPVNFGKIQMLLSEMPHDWADRRALSVLDVGAGPGTASLAVLDWIAGQARATPVSLHVVAVDRSSSALVEAPRLWEVFGPQAVTGRADLTTIADHVDKIAQHGLSPTVSRHSPFDLIIVANCLNELFRTSVDPAAQREALLGALLAALKPDGTLMLLEPALRSSARELHQTRDRLLDNGLCTVYSPCLHDLKCPALVRASDWCHEERPWKAPDWITDFDRELGFIKDALKFSYLLLRKDGRVIAQRDPDMYRIVSDLRVFKGEKRAWVCSGQGRSDVGRLDRFARDSNRAFDSWHRGALVQIDRIVRKEREGKISEIGRIPEDGIVRIVRSV